MSSALGASDADPDRLREETTDPGDPRGGYQDEEYRTAEPTELVDTGGRAMMGPGGAPQEGKDAEELQRHNEEWRREHPGGPGEDPPDERGSDARSGAGTGG